MDKVALIGRTVSEACRHTLVRCGYHPIRLPPYDRLSRPVQSHPDLFLSVLGNTVLTFRDYHRHAAAAFDRLLSLRPDLRLVLTGERPAEKYPDDILLNAAPIGPYLFGRLNRLSPALLRLANASGLRPVDIPQGYARCSICVVSDHAIITADRGIKKAAEKCGIDTLLIRPGHVRLEGFDYGFIGGTSGCDGRAVYFCGDISAHPDYEAIAAFCHRHGKEPVALSDEPLTDAGSLFLL